MKVMKSDELGGTADAVEDSDLALKAHIVTWVSKIYLKTTLRIVINKKQERSYLHRSAYRGGFRHSDYQC